MSAKSDVKSYGSTIELHWKLVDLSTGEESGIPGVAVECVDIRRNTKSEGSFWTVTDPHGRKRG